MAMTGDDKDTSQHASKWSSLSALLLIVHNALFSIWFAQFTVVWTFKLSGEEPYGIAHLFCYSMFYILPVWFLGIGVFALVFRYVSPRTDLSGSIRFLIHLYGVLLPVLGLQNILKSDKWAEESANTKWSGIVIPLLDVWFFLWPSLQAVIFSRWAILSGGSFAAVNMSSIPDIVVGLLHSVTFFGCLLRAERVSTGWKRAAWFAAILFLFPVSIPIFWFVRGRPR